MSINCCPAPSSENPRVVSEPDEPYLILRMLPNTDIDVPIKNICDKYLLEESRSIYTVEAVFNGGDRYCRSWDCFGETSSECYVSDLCICTWYSSRIDWKTSIGIVDYHKWHGGYVLREDVYEESWGSVQNQIWMMRVIREFMGPSRTNWLLQSINCDLGTQRQDRKRFEWSSSTERNNGRSHSERYLNHYKLRHAEHPKHWGYSQATGCYQV